MKQDAIEVVGASWVIPMTESPEEQDLQPTIIENGAVAMRDGKIVEVGDYASIIEQHSLEQTASSHTFFDDQILLPGLINCHGHMAMSLLRGYADDLNLQNWLEDHIWPAEARLVSETFVYDGAQLAIAEMLLTGTTTASDMYFYPESTAKAAAEAGIRCNIFFPILEFPSAWGGGPQEYLEKGLALRDTYKQSTAISIGLGPHAPYTVSNASFEKAVMYSEELDAPIQTHLHETAREIEDSIKEHGCRPIERLQQLGALGANTQLVHMTQTSEQDLAILKTQGCSVIHCPHSNLKLASGFPPVSALQRANIALGFGTDGAASNNSLDLFETLRISALVGKHLDEDAASNSSYRALYQATKGGAIAAGLENLTGSLDIGKQADLITVNTRNIGMQPLHNPVSQLVHTAAGKAVSNVWVSGKQLVSEGELIHQDAQELVEKAQRWQRTISEADGD